MTRRQLQMTLGAVAAGCGTSTLSPGQPVTPLPAVNPFPQPPVLRSRDEFRATKLVATNTPGAAEPCVGSSMPSSPCLAARSSRPECITASVSQGLPDPGKGSGHMTGPEPGRRQETRPESVAKLFQSSPL